MDVRRENGGLEFSEIDPFLAELLRQIPESARPNDSATARARLFAAPIDESEPDFRQEWKQLIEPELERLFRSSTDTVAHDLRPMCGNARALTNHRLRG